MQPNRPWNVWPMDVGSIIKRDFLGEVTSPLMYEPSTSSFHPFGLYSESIFGQIGTPDRISRLGYISLHSDILSPLIFLNIINVCGWYQDIMESKVHATWDQTNGCFVPAEKENPSASTGYAFFMEHVSSLKFQRNNSVSRNNKISVIEQTIQMNCHVIRHWLVCPAGWRDVKTDVSGRVEVDEVNKLYNSLLMMSLEIKNGANNPILRTFFNNVKYHVQLKVVEIFNHWKNFYEGKTGFGQAHYAKRNLALGTRGVITAPTLMADSPESPSYIKHNETQLSVFHAAKAFEPIVIHALNVLFTSQVYTLGSIQVPAIDPATLKTKYVEIVPAQVTYALDTQSKHDLINSFKDTDGRHDEVYIMGVDGKKYWLWAVYDTGKDIYLLRNIDDFEKLLSAGGSSKKIPLAECPTLTLPYIQPHWDTVIKSYKKLGIDLSDIKFELSSVPRDNNGDVAENFDPIKFGGCWTKNKIVYLNPNLKDVIAYYTGATTISGLETFNYYLEHLIAHELAHEVHENIATESEIKALQDAAIKSDFTTDYLRTIDKTNQEKYKKELYCEWLAESVIPQIESNVTVDRQKIRALTKIEMLYLATYAATHDKFCTITRFPAVEVGSIYPSKVSVLTTSPDRVVNFKSQYSELGDMVLPHYPRINIRQYIDSTIVHPSKTPGLNADFDGDKVSVNGIMSSEALAEARKHLESPASMISPAGKFYNTANTNSVRYALHALTMLPDGLVLPEAE